MIKRLKKLAAASLHSTTLPEALFRSKAKRNLTILAYHRIGPLPGSDYPFDEEIWSATPEEFRRELAYFRRHLDVMTVAELEQGLRQPESLPLRPAVITFDDGYADNYETALPLLREAGLTACFFLSTQIVGTAQIPWWDQVVCCFKFSKAAVFPSPFGADDPPYRFDSENRKPDTQRFLIRIKQAAWPGNALKALAALKETTGVQPEAYASKPLFMTWKQANEMTACGMEVGGHTRTHPILGRISDLKILEAEIGGCYDDLKRELRINPLAFAYPVGGKGEMSPMSDQAIRCAGFSLSFSYEHRFAPRRPETPFRLPRLHAEFGEDFNAFRMEMAKAKS